MDIKAILKANGIDGEVVDTIAETIKAEIPKEFVSKTQYAKKVNAIDDLNIKIADLEAKGNTDEYKSKFETLETEYNNFKANIEAEKVNLSKTNILRSKLKNEGVNDKLINLLLKEFEIEKIELDGEEVKDWENVIKPVKENYVDLFPQTQTQGNPANTPPAKGNDGQGQTIYTPPTMI